MFDLSGRKRREADKQREWDKTWKGVESKPPRGTPAPHPKRTGLAVYTDPHGHVDYHMTDTGWSKDT